MKAKYINPFTDLGFKKIFGEEEGYDYEQNLKIHRDLKGVIDTAFDDGKLEVAKNLKLEGMSTEFITKVTGLPKAEIERL